MLAQARFRESAPHARAILTQIACGDSVCDRFTAALPRRAPTGRSGMTAKLGGDRSEAPPILAVIGGSHFDERARVAALPRALWLVPLLLGLAAWGWFDVRVRGVINPADPGAHKTDLTVYT